MNENLLPKDEIISVGEIQALSEIIDWGLIDFATEILWQKNKGENITIMVCDTGYTHHEDLKDNIIYDKAISFVGDGDYTDHQGHGTSVAGVISAKDSGYGTVGVAPCSKIIPVKVLSNHGFVKENSLEDGLEYALKIKPDIINMSLGGQYPLSPKFNSLLKQLYNLNIPIICAMGNYGDKYSCYPAEYPETIGVTSYKKNRAISNFSSRSADADFALPGEEILTTSLNNKYTIANGTSFSAPFLSGIIAIIICEYKKKNIPYTVESIKNLLIESCKDYGPSGKDNMFGYGIIDANVLKNLI